jgi:hypothetical protein
MNAHIINCDDHDLFINQYRANGYIGVGIKTNESTSGSLKSACRTSYSMYADMKTIYPGDMIFIHAGDVIYGVFEAKSYFKEDPNTDSLFLSRNIHFDHIPNNPDTGWQTLVNQQIPAHNYYRQLSISHFVDNKGRNLCFKKGFSANDVFDLRRQGEIWSIPERWKYPDFPRTVRPLMITEAQEFIKLLERENTFPDSTLTITPKDLSSFLDINLILDPTIVQNEKIIEAYLCGNLLTPALQEIFGKITTFGNNVQIGYLQGIDILGCTEGIHGISKYKVIEVKVNACLFPKDIQQIFKYIDWVIEHQTSGNPKYVEGFIVANSFDDECKNFVRNLNRVNKGKQLSLVTFDYNRPSCRSLMLTKVSL